jgi:quaternary ammonium compound-resistance protein SugE
VSWIVLIVAGLFEVVMALSLENSEGFRKPGWIVAFLVTGGVSFYLLAVALRELPVGTAYAVWTGIGAVGTAVLGILLLGESATPWRLGAILLIVVGIVGLKLAPGS